MLSAVFFFLLGLAVITFGSEILLKGASKIASLLYIRPIVIGLTVVSIGTSLPELAVGLTAIKEGAGDIAIGNIAGTNLVNILFILGLSAAIRPLALNLKSIKTELFTMILAAVLLFVFALDGHLGVLDGGLMLLLGIIYLVVVVRSSRKESKVIHAEYEKEYDIHDIDKKSKLRVWSWHVILLIGGVVATVYGAELLVGSAVSIAQYFGMSDAVIGLTIIAIGTSAPELATTMVATMKNDRDVAIGNLLGSSIMNIFFILAITIILTPGGVNVASDILWFDLPLAALVALACYPVFRSDQMVSRGEGIVFVLVYLLYLGYLLFARV